MNEINEFKEVPIKMKVVYVSVFLIINFLLSVLISQLLDWWFIFALLIVVLFWVAVIGLASFWNDIDNERHKEAEKERERKQRGY